MNVKEISSMIDHTQLAPDAGEEKIKKLCSEADSYGFASVCVNPVYVPFASECLKNSEVKVCTVIGFPLGASSSKVKAFETVDAIQNGADEVDMVINIGAAKDNRFDVVKSDISMVVNAARSCEKEIGKTIVVKVILETCLLTDDEIVQCCKCAEEAGADFVKTSTGFATPKDKDGNLLPNGATEHHVKLMSQTVGNRMKVKASGGIRTAETAAVMVAAGCHRIGTSSGVKIAENWKE